MSDWMSQFEFKDLYIILHFFRFVQIFLEVFRYFLDILQSFHIFWDLLRYILLELSGFIYLYWHKTRAKGKFVQWITLDFFSLWTSQTPCNMTINALWQFQLYIHKSHSYHSAESLLLALTLYKADIKHQQMEADWHW